MYLKQRIRRIAEKVNPKGGEFVIAETQKETDEKIAQLKKEGKKIAVFIVAQRFEKLGN
jgi:L-lactate utilization protein LutB